MVPLAVGLLLLLLLGCRVEVPCVRLMNNREKPPKVVAGAAVVGFSFASHQELSLTGNRPVTRKVCS